MTETGSVTAATSRGCAGTTGTASNRVHLIGSIRVFRVWSNRVHLRVIGSIRV